jgi:hypothetical protein
MSCPVGVKHIYKTLHMAARQRINTLAFKTKATQGPQLTPESLHQTGYCAADQNPDCNALSIDSQIGRTWSKHYGWRFDTSTAEDPEMRAAENKAAREAAYHNLVTKNSPWPDWFEPTLSLLPAGTLFQMAMSSAQPDNRPGGFGTFDEIDTLIEVREDLAVLKAWKPDVQRVNTYRVTEALPVNIGPVGPQIDPEACALLPGRFSQFQMVVPPQKRMNHMKLIESHALPPEVLQGCADPACMLN